MERRRSGGQIIPKSQYLIFDAREFYLCGYGSVVECDLPKVEIRVRFPLPAQEPFTFYEK